MMDLLVFQLSGAMAAFGDIAVGETRSTHDTPSLSNVFGLLAAAFGTDRTEEAKLQQLQAGYRIAIGTITSGHVLRDYHTTQVAGQVELKKRPHRTRQDELNFAKHDLHTILSTRDYRTSGDWLVALQQVNDDPAYEYSIPKLIDALHAPKYVLYLGRKSCPLDLPLYPKHMLKQDNVVLAFNHYIADLARRYQQGQEMPQYARSSIHLNQHFSHMQSRELAHVSWDENWLPEEIGAFPLFSTRQQDRLLSRQRWQYAPRTLHIATISKPPLTDHKDGITT